MFRNREIRMQLVKKNDEPNVSSTTVGHWHIDEATISKIVVEQMRNAAIVVGGVYAVKTILDTASEIAIIKAKSNS